MPPPVPPKPVVLEYADGSRMWSSTDGYPQPTVVRRVLRELLDASVSYDSLRAVGGVVRTTIDAKAQTTAAAVIGRLVTPDRESDAGAMAIDPASGGVRVYLPYSRRTNDPPDDVPWELNAALFEPFALAGVPTVAKERMTSLDVTATYATIAARGVQRKPHLVSTVTAADGSLLYKADETARLVFDEGFADRMTESLKQNPACNGVACVSGAAPWMVGYTPQLAVTMYVQKAGAVDAGLPRVIWQEFLAG